MRLRKYANNEGAEAFADAVKNSDEVTTKQPDKPEKDRLEPTPVSWSDSQNLEYADEVAQIGVDSRGPAFKGAALQRAVDRASGPHADLIKEAFRGKALAYGLMRGGQKATQAAARGTGMAAQGAWRGGQAAMQGMNTVGKKSRQFLRGKPGFKQPTAGQAVTNVGTEVGLQSYNLTHNT